MPQRHDDSELLTRYFLGEVSSAERDLVEEQCFSTHEALEELLQAEDELIDDYVRGALTGPDRVLFEKNFMFTNRRRQTVEFTQSIVEALTGFEFYNSPRRDDYVANVRDYVKAKDQQASFVRILTWLDPVRERAVEKYETIRTRLIRMFSSRGLIDAEERADETMERVARNSAQLRETYEGDPAMVYYRVARLVLLGASHPPMVGEIAEADARGDAEPSRGDSCLQKCLAELSEEDRELILEYYGSEKTTKIDRRKGLAQSLGISLGALRIRTSRIRTSLRKCVESCLEKSE